MHQYSFVSRAARALHQRGRRRAERSDHRFSIPEGAYDVDQARGRGRGRHDGSHRLRRDTLRRTAIGKGLAKASPLLFPGASHPSRDRRGRRIPPVELLVPHLPGRPPRSGAARPRSQSSAAVSADGRRWFLLNASPDVRAQLASLPSAEPAGHAPRAGRRRRAHRRRAGSHARRSAAARRALPPVYATAAVRRIVEHDSRIVPVDPGVREVRLEICRSERRARCPIATGPPAA